MSDALANLPALPDDTDLTVAPLDEAGEELQVTLRLANARRVIRQAYGWAFGLVVLGIAAALAVVVPLWESGYGWLGLIPACVAFGNALFFFMVPSMVDKRSAAVFITAEELTIFEQHLETDLSLSFGRADVLSVEQGRAEKRELLFGEGRREPGGFFGVRYGRKAQLELELAERRRVGVLSGWKAPDLAWLAEVLRRRWGLRRQLATVAAEAPVGISVEQMHDRSAMVWLAPLFVVAGAVVFGIGLWPTVQGLRSIDWPPVDGTVVEARYMVTGGADGAVSYAAHAVYSYEVEGIGYTGDRISFAVGAGEERVRRLIEPLSEGDTVRVYVDPANPARSVLVPGVGAMYPWLIGAGALLVLLAGVMCVGLVRLRRMRLAIEQFDPRTRERSVQDER